MSQLIHKMEEALPQNVPDFLGGIYGELIFYYSCDLLEYLSQRAVISEVFCDGVG